MQEINEAVTQISNSKKLLVSINPQATYDEIASMVAFVLLLVDLQKKVLVVIPQNSNPLISDICEKYKVSTISSLEPLNYIISIPYDQGEVEKVSYDTTDGKVNLYITPGPTEFDFENVRYAVSGSNFDSIVTFGCRSLKWLDEVYSKNTKIFKRTKIININNRKGAQEYGDFKVVDAKNQTLSEIIYEFIALLGGSQNQNVIDVLAEGLVAGIDLLQKGKISNNSSTVLSSLINAGANIKTSINQVYFSAPGDNFKLMKKSLETIKKDDNSGIVWSVLNISTLNQLGIDKNKLFKHVRLPFNISSLYKVAFQIIEIESGKIIGTVESREKNVSALEITKEYNGKGTTYRAEFTALDKSLSQVEQAILSKIQTFLHTGEKFKVQPKEENTPQKSEETKNKETEKKDTSKTGLIKLPELTEVEDVPLGIPDSNE